MDTRRQLKSPNVGTRDERGSALIIAILVVAVLALLGSVFLSTSRTENTIAMNEIKKTRAFLIADSGTEHARKSLEGLNLSAVLAGTTDVFPGGNTVNLGGGTYTVEVTNNYDGAGADFPRGTIPEDSASGGCAPSATVDCDGIVVVTSTGTFMKTQQVIEATVGSPGFAQGAVITSGDLEISGNPTVNGSPGSIHTNSDLDISGTVTVAQDLTASGSYNNGGSTTVGGVEGGGKATVDIPPVVPADYRSLADYVLKADGRVYQSDGTTVVFDTTGGNAWPSNDGGWKISGDKWDWGGDQVGGQADSVFYVEGNVVIGSNPGQSGSDWQVTLVVEGYIEISGNPEMQANTDDLLVVAGTDVKINATTVASGIIAAHEQVGIGGSLNLTGYIIAEDAATNDDMVEFNYISGEPQITYNGNLSTLGAGGGAFGVLAWRQVQ